MRSEREVFEDLEKLTCASGYVHAIAYICYKDNFLAYSEQITPTDMLKMFSPDRLIRNEISTVVGLLIKSPIDFRLPSQTDLEGLVNNTYQLLEELHESVSHDLFDSVRSPGSISDALSRGSVLREPIFYSGESAFSFQYRDFAAPKYGADNEWLLANKGFTIEDGRDVVLAIGKLQNERVADVLHSLRQQDPEGRTILPGFCFTIADIAARCSLSSELIAKVIGAYAISEKEHNDIFKSIHDFNIIRATPILRRDDTTFLLLEQYSLVEALYDAPFYWMGADHKYSSVALSNRGRFTESFSKDRLEKVFGASSVYSNVDIVASKGKKIGEIDVLVLFADRAIILQAKSKKLTLEARKGNDLKLQNDFKKSIQDSYDQGFLCAEALRDPAFTLIAGDGKHLSTPTRVRETYIFCVIADHYPALAFQSEQFLKVQSNNVIRPPMILDVFALDALCEMLDSPLHFLNYIKRRTEYWEKLHAPDEMTILSFHLKRGLWLDEAYDRVQLTDDISVDLEVAMTVRRDNIPGKRTPDGILTRFEGTTLSKLLKTIESSKDPAALNLGITILGMNQSSSERLNAGVEEILRLTRGDGEHHDVTVGSTAAKTGVTFHCNRAPISNAYSTLRDHCEKKKYVQRASSWFGACLNGYTGQIRCSIELLGEWRHNPYLEKSLSR
jgi:hypothetical protein